MGKVLSVISKPIRDYNIESRAHKVISKDKPTAAPMHKANRLEYEKILKEYPNVVEETQTKHMDLDERLKNIFVKSHDPDVNIKIAANPDRPLPLNRKTVEDFEYGFHEPEKVSPGRITIKNALKFINDNQTDPKTHTISKISDEYLLPEETVSNVLKYFKIFELYIPEERKVKATFVGPRVQRHLLEVKEPKQLKSGENEENKK